MVEKIAGSLPAILFQGKKLIERDALFPSFRVQNQLTLISDLLERAGDGRAVV